MRKIFSIIFVMSLFVLCGCDDYNDKNFEGLDDLVKPSHTSKFVYTMGEEDYAAVADHATNKALAKEEEEKNGVAGAVKALAAVKTSLGFSEVTPADKYAPAFLAAKWFTVDQGASVKLTYDKVLVLPEYVRSFAQDTVYTLSAKDYQSAWGEESKLNFFTPEKPAGDYLIDILTNAFPTPTDGQYMYVSFNQSEKEPVDVTYAFQEDFELGEANKNISLGDWSNVAVAGTFAWQCKMFSGNKYAQQSAYKHDGKLDSYLISKEIEVGKGMELTFDAVYVNYLATGGSLSVLVSTNLADVTPAAIEAATWNDLTSKFEILTSSNNTGDPANVGSADLAAYAGKKIRIAFRYQGDVATKATSTIRLDNVVVATSAKNKYSIVTNLYSYNNEGWSLYTKNNLRVLSQADFVEMGAKYDNFSSSMNADNYLPTFLNIKYPYAQEGNALAVAYKYFASSKTKIRTDEYLRKGGVWVKNNARETLTEQFVYSGGKWMFDPGVKIVLGAKGDAETSTFYQTLTDWVKANKGAQYVSSYGNNDYYYGGSAYQNNFDFRADKWKEQAEEYKAMSDEDLVKLMFKRLQEAFIPGLEKYYADAKPLTGIEIVYTIDFFVYDGKTTDLYTIQYVVVGEGKFEYKEESLQKKKV